MLQWAKKNLDWRSRNVFFWIFQGGVFPMKLQNTWQRSSNIAWVMFHSNDKQHTQVQQEKNKMGNIAKGIRLRTVSKSDLSTTQKTSRNNHTSLGKSFYFCVFGFVFDIYIFLFFCQHPGIHILTKILFPLYSRFAWFLPGSEQPVFAPSNSFHLWLGQVLPLS